MYTGSLIIPIPYTHKNQNLQIPSSFVMNIMWFFIFKKLTAGKCHHLSTSKAWMRQHTSFA